ncbi:FUSC family protein [Kitasatospora sp. NPDC089797]|uniref:FUSC family protein n=1 Tax=Kitasatospora sp. NPDC089797 TaxID=3155298 RepID=UPI003414192D
MSRRPGGEATAVLGTARCGGGPRIRAAAAATAAGLRAAALAGLRWRPENPADLTYGLVAGLGIAVPLLLGVLGGHPAEGADVATAALFVAIPSLTGGLRARAGAIGLRTAAVTLAGVWSVYAVGLPWAGAVLITAAAVAGALWPALGANAALALLIIGVDGSGRVVGFAGALQLLGGAWLALLAAVLFGGRALRSRSRRTARRPAGPGSGVPRAEQRAARRGRAVRLGLLVAATTAVLTGLGAIRGEGHWLVTSVLISSQVSCTATGVKAGKRVVGNSVGAVAVTAVLLLAPSPPVLAVVTGCCALAAFTVRPANYLYWAMCAPPLLILLEDMAKPMSWSAGAVRVLLNVLGGVLAVTAVHLHRSGASRCPCPGRGTDRPAGASVAAVERTGPCAGPAGGGPRCRDGRGAAPRRAA